MGRNSSRGRSGGGRGGCALGRNSGRGCGRGSGYTPKPRAIKTGLCKDLKGHVFDYGAGKVANLLLNTQEKIAQYVGTKYSKDIEKEFKNKLTVTLPAPSYLREILARHQEWGKLSGGTRPPC